MVEDGRLVGVVTRVDVLGALVSVSAAERALARIDLGAIERNCAPRCRDAELCAVVKADGYGHGAVLVRRGRARRRRRAGWRWPRRPRRPSCARHGIDGPMLVMGALTARSSHGARGRRRRRGLDARSAGATRAAPRVHVKLDTGMGRLGTKDPARRGARGARPQRPTLAGLMTHFATADEPGDDHFPAQLERFRAFVGERAGATTLLVHAANSAATLRDPAAHFDMVRCGIAIYGLDPFQADPAAHGLEPALSLSRTWPR